MLLNPFAIV